MDELLLGVRVEGVGTQLPPAPALLVATERVLEVDRVPVVDPDRPGLEPVRDHPGPSLGEELRKAHTAVLPGYHLHKGHWNPVIIDGSLPDQTVGDMIEDSYDLVMSKLPRARRRALGWRVDL